VSRCAASSGLARATCCRWTPNAWRASAAPATGSPGTATAAAPRNARASATSSATRRSTTTPGSPTPGSTPTSAPAPSPASPSAPSAFFADLGIRARRIQTDNAFTYTRNRSLKLLLGERGIAHRRIPPRTPKRNGRIERYQQTLAREWAHGQRYRDSDARAAALPHWRDHYNYTRNHSSLSNRPPISRLFGRS
jgi:hypothetical protein